HAYLLAFRPAGHDPPRRTGSRGQSPGGRRRHGPDLPQPAHQADRALPTRRPHRRGLAPGRPAARNPPGPARRRGKPARTSAANQLRRAPADGYTLLMLATPTLFAPFFYKNTGYETPKDFQPVATVYDLPIVVVVNPQKLPDITTLTQLADYARAHPGELNYA